MTGGYAVAPEEGGDFCELCDPCGQVIEVIDACDPCGQVVDPCGLPIQEILEDGCGCGPMTPQGQAYEVESVIIGDFSETDTESESDDQDAEAEDDQQAADDSNPDSDSELGQNKTPDKPSFLERSLGWFLPSNITNS